MTHASPIFAIVTPFTVQGEVDYTALQAYLAFLSARGVTRIIAGGTTGEFSSLTLGERQQLLEHCRRQFQGQVIAHVSATCAADVKELLLHATQHADASLLLPPYYFADAPPAGVLEFIVDCASSTTMPLYLYNFPKHTQHPLTPELVEKVRVRVPHLQGLKDSSGSVEKSIGLARAAEGLEIYVGSDSAALRVLQEGLSGSVTGGASPVPQILVSLTDAYRRDDLDKAVGHQEKLNAWSDVRKGFAAHEISVVKSALSALIPGFQPYVRPPLASVDDEMGGAIRRAMQGWRETK